MGDNHKKVSSIMERTKERQAANGVRQAAIMQVVITLAEMQTGQPDVVVQRPACQNLSEYAGVLDTMTAGIIKVCQTMAQADTEQEGYAHEIINLAAIMRRLCRKQAGIKVSPIVSGKGVILPPHPGSN